MMLKHFKVGSYEYGVIAGPKGDVIITETDFCHAVYGPGEAIELRGAMPWEKDVQHFQRLTPEEINAIAQPVTSFRKWAHYWGIKSRIHINYGEFLNSMREVGADTSQMPKWGKETGSVLIWIPWLILCLSLLVGVIVGFAYRKNSGLRSVSGIGFENVWVSLSSILEICNVHPNKVLQLPFDDSLKFLYRKILTGQKGASADSDNAPAFHAQHFSLCGLRAAISRNIRIRDLDSRANTRANLYCRTLTGIFDNHFNVPLAVGLLTEFHFPFYAERWAFGQIEKAFGLANASFHNVQLATHDFLLPEIDKGLNGNSNKYRDAQGIYGKELDALGHVWEVDANKEQDAKKNPASQNDHPQPSVTPFGGLVVFVGVAGIALGFFVLWHGLNLYWGADGNTKTCVLIFCFVVRIWDLVRQRWRERSN